MLKKISSFIQNYPKFILVAIAVLTVFFAVPLLNFKADTSLRLLKPDYINDATDKWDSLQPSVSFFRVIIESPNESVLSLPALKEQDYLIKSIERFLEEKNCDNIEIKGFVKLLEKKIQRHSGKNIADIKDQEELNSLLIDIFAEAPEEFKENLQSFLSAEYDPDVLNHFLKKKKVFDFIPFSFLFSSNLNFELPDSKTSLFWFETSDKNFDFKNFKNFAAPLREKINALGLERINVHILSSALIGHDADSMIGVNSLILGIFIVGLISLIIFLFFRKLLFVAIPLIIMAVSIIWTLGLMTLLGVTFTTFNSIIFPLLIGIGIDGPIHLSERFSQEIKNKNEKTAGDNQKRFSRAIGITYRQTGFGLFLAAFTTVLAFISNIVWPGISGALWLLGVTICLGLLVTLFLTYVLWGAILSLFRRNVAAGFEKQNSSSFSFFKKREQRFKKISQMIFKFSMAHSVMIFVLLGVFSVISVISIPSLKTNIKMSEVMPENSQSYKAYVFWENQEADKYEATAVLIEGNVLDAKVISALDRLENKVQSEEFLRRFEGKVKFKSVNTLARELGIKISNQADLKSFYDSLFQNNNLADPFLELTWKDEAEKIVFKDSHGNYQAIAAFVWIYKGSAGGVRQAASGLEKDIASSGLNAIPNIKVSLAGDSVFEAQAEGYLRENQFKSFGLAIVLNFFVLFLIYRNFLRNYIPTRLHKSRAKLILRRAIFLSFIILIPIVIASLLTVGVMAFLQISLTLFNVMVISITIGLGVDYAIYLSNSYLEELKKGRDRQKAAQRALENMNSAFWAAAITTIAGFSMLSFSFLPVAKSFGILSAFAIFLAVLITLFLLPILLVRFVKNE